MLIIFLLSLVQGLKNLNQSEYHHSVAQKDCVIFFTHQNNRNSMQPIAYQLERFYDYQYPDKFNFYEVDVQQNQQILEELDIKRPHILLYKNGKQIDIEYFIYDEIKNKIDQLYDWDIVQIEKEYEFHDLAREYQSILIHYGDQQEVFTEFCRERYELGTKCAILRNKDIMVSKKINLSYNTAAYQKWSDKFFYLEQDTTVENLDKFLTIYSRPLVEEFSDNMMQKLFSKNQTLAILFQPKLDVDGFKNFLRFSYDIRLLDEKNWIFIVNNNLSNHNFDSFFGVEDIEKPEIYILKFDETGMKKYKYDENMDQIEFYRKIKEKNMPSFFKSEPEVPFTSGNIQQLVGTNFESTILGQDNCIFLFYNKKNQTLLEIFEPINNYNKVQIYIIDLFKNEVGKYQPPYEPAIIIKSNGEFKPFSGQLSIEEMVEFIDKELKIGLKKYIFTQSETLSQFEEDDTNSNIFRDEDDDEL